MTKDNTKHTPGTWEIHDYDGFSFTNGVGPTICAMTGPSTCQPLFEFIGPADPEECAANGNLVIAAPGLLEACKSVLPLVRNSAVSGHYGDKLAIAIAKAEGRS